MSGWKNHILFGCIFSLLVLGYLNMLPKDITLIPLFAFICLGSIAPDIDHKDSKASNLLVFSVLILGILMILNNTPQITLIILVVYVIWCFIRPPHRGMLHGITFWLPFGVILLVISFLHFNQIIYPLGFVLGVFSHLILDRKW